IFGLAVHPGGARCATASYDHTVKLWDLEAPGEPTTLTGSDKTVSTADLHPDGRRLLLSGQARIPASNEPLLEIWDLAKGELLRKSKGRSDWANAVFSRDGRRFAPGHE